MDDDRLDQLLANVQRDEPGAMDALLAVLVDAYGGRLYGLLRKLTGRADVAEDLVQETYLRVVRMVGSYEHQGRFGAWLFRIAGNLARDHVRKQQRRGVASSLQGGDDEQGAMDWPDDCEVDAIEPLIIAESVAELDVALGQLSTAERELILLRHYSDLSFREIAELLGQPLGTVLARGHRALKRLRQILVSQAGRSSGRAAAAERVTSDAPIAATES